MVTCDECLNYPGNEKCKENPDGVGTCHPSDKCPCFQSKEYHKTDWGYAQRLVALHRTDFHFCKSTDKFLVYDGKIWNDDKYAQMEHYVRELYLILWNEAMLEQDMNKKRDLVSLALKAQSAHKMTSILQMVKSEPTIPITPESFDKNVMLFNVQNGTIDLKTGTLRPHNKSDYITKISPVVYDPEAKCPTWLKFLDKIFQSNKDIIEYLQRRSGYILTGDTREEDFEIYYGIGSNGKSVYTGTIEYITGDYSKKVNVETIQETYKAGSNSASSDVARLKGARFASVSEPEKGIQLNESRVKDWTGRDRITARFLYQEPFTFIPEFKMVIYTNHKPRIKGQDNGIWRRVKFVPFEITISEEEQDKNLPDKLKLESSGILNWMIEGCLKWQKDGLKTPKEIIQATEEYKEEQDYLGEFFNDCCEIDKNRTTPLKWIFLVYQAYCQIKKLSQQNHITFPQTLEERGYHRQKTNKGKVFHGIGLKPSLTQKCIEMESISEDAESDSVTVMTVFLESQLKNSYYKGLSENLSPTVIQERGALQTVTLVTVNPSQPVTESSHLGVTETKTQLKFTLERCAEYLKQNYSKFGIPGEDHPRITQNMVNNVMVEFEDLEEGDAWKVVMDYQRARGWT